MAKVLPLNPSLGQAEKVVAKFFNRSTSILIAQAKNQRHSLAILYDTWQLDFLRLNSTTGMDLKTFITETLVQIVDAVVDAQTNVQNKGALINPRMAEEPRQPAPGALKKSIPDPALVSQLGFYLTADNRKADMIEFDVAVTASSTAEENATAKGGVKAGLGIHVVSLEVGGKTESGSGITRSDERVSRVKFRIPIALPQH